MFRQKAQARIHRIHPKFWRSVLCSVEAIKRTHLLSQSLSLSLSLSTNRLIEWSHFLPNYSGQSPLLSPSPPALSLPILHAYRPTERGAADDRPSDLVPAPVLLPLGRPEKRIALKWKHCFHFISSIHNIAASLARLGVGLYYPSTPPPYIMTRGRKKSTLRLID